MPTVFANRLRNVHASGMNVVRGGNFEHFKFFCALALNPTQFTTNLRIGT